MIGLFLLGLVCGAMLGALGVALAAAAAGELPNQRTSEPARVMLYDENPIMGRRPATQAGTYRVHQLWPGQVLQIRGRLIVSAPNGPSTPGESDANQAFGRGRV